MSPYRGSLQACAAAQVAPPFPHIPTGVAFHQGLHRSLSEEVKSQPLGIHLPFDGMIPRKEKQGGWNPTASATNQRGPPPAGSPGAHHRDSKGPSPSPRVIPEPDATTGNGQATGEKQRAPPSQDPPGRADEESRLARARVPVSPASSSRSQRPEGLGSQRESRTPWASPVPRCTDPSLPTAPGQCLEGDPPILLRRPHFPSQHVSGLHLLPSPDL